MCEISGIWNLDGSPVELATLPTVGESLRHRGSDDEGIHLNGPIGLGHLRLSIIDLDKGHQSIRISLKDGLLGFSRVILPGVPIWRRGHFRHEYIDDLLERHFTEHNDPTVTTHQIWSLLYLELRSREYMDKRSPARLYANGIWSL